MRTTAAVGSATYSETVQFSGTLRARLGYAAGNWLFYLTGGFAWSFDQFSARKTRARALEATWQPARRNEFPTSEIDRPDRDALRRRIQSNRRTRRF